MSCFRTKLSWQLNCRVIQVSLSNQVSQQCMTMVAGKALEIGPHLGSCLVNETSMAVQQGKDTITVKNIFFLTVVPIVQFFPGVKSVHHRPLLAEYFPSLHHLVCSIQMACPWHANLTALLMSIVMAFIFTSRRYGIMISLAIHSRHPRFCLVI
jgi:hypothetical protein